MRRLYFASCLFQSVFSWKSVDSGRESAREPLWADVCFRGGIYSHTYFHCWQIFMCSGAGCPGGWGCRLAPFAVFRISFFLSPALAPATICACFSTRSLFVLVSLCSFARSRICHFAAPPSVHPQNRPERVRAVVRVCVFLASRAAHTCARGEQRRSLPHSRGRSLSKTVFRGREKSCAHVESGRAESSHARQASKTQIRLALLRPKRLPPPHTCTRPVCKAQTHARGESDDD